MLLEEMFELLRDINEWIESMPRRLHALIMGCFGSLVYSILRLLAGVPTQTVSEEGVGIAIVGVILSYYHYDV